MVTTYGMTEKIGPINLNEEDNYGNLSTKISNKKRNC